jgi:hypothetical protein
MTQAKEIVQRDMTDDELKGMLGHIRLNTGFSFPDQLIQDFMDGDIVPTFKKCLHFNRGDFRTLLHPILKKKMKRMERPKTQGRKKMSRRIKRI